jgi:hypothetical protein
MTHNETKLTYSLRGIPPELWREAKIRSAETGIPIRHMLLTGLAMWLDQRKEHQLRGLSDRLRQEEADFALSLNEIAKIVVSKPPLPEGE